MDTASPRVPYFPAPAKHAVIKRPPAVPEPVTPFLLDSLPVLTRRPLHAWVLGSVAVCLAILAVAVLGPP